MASSARRDPVRELTLLVRAPEPGTSNLGEFLANNARGLAQVLGLPADDFEAARILDDEDLAPRIRQLLERARDRHVQQISNAAVSVPSKPLVFSARPPDGRASAPSSMSTCSSASCSPTGP